jgi:hypothetical protein
MIAVIGRFVRREPDDAGIRGAGRPGLNFHHGDPAQRALAGRTTGAVNPGIIWVSRYLSARPWFAAGIEIP